MSIPIGWIPKPNLLSMFVDLDSGKCLFTTRQLKEWSVAKLVKAPFEDRTGTRGAKPHFAPDTPDRIQLILPMLQNNLPYVDIRFWLWMEGFDFDKRTVKLTLFQLLAPNLFDKRGRPVPIVEGPSPEEDIDQAYELAAIALKATRRKFSKSGLPRLLESRIGNRRQAKDMLEAVAVQTVGGRLHFGKSELIQDPSLAESHHAVVDVSANHLGLAVPEASPEYMEGLLAHISDKGYFSLPYMFNLIAEMDDSGLSEFRSQIAQSISSFPLQVMVNHLLMGSDVATVLERNLSPESSALDALLTALYQIVHGRAYEASMEFAKDYFGWDFPQV